MWKLMGSDAFGGQFAHQQHTVMQEQNKQTNAQTKELQTFVLQLEVTPLSQPALPGQYSVLNRTKKKQCGYRDQIECDRRESDAQNG